MQGAIAALVRTQSTVAHAWLAARLQMRSAANESQQVRRFLRGEPRHRPTPVRRWMDSVRICD